MSDQTNPGGGADDFRGTAAEKRKDETVMVNAEDLSKLVSNARQESAAAEPRPAAAYQPPAAPAPAAKSGPPVALIAGLLGVVAVIIVIVLVVMLAG